VFGLAQNNPIPQRILELMLNKECICQAPGSPLEKIIGPITKMNDVPPKYIKIPNDIQNL